MTAPALPAAVARLVANLGDPDPTVRDERALPGLCEAVPGLAPGERRRLGTDLLAGLQEGLGEDGTDSVLRRSFSALVLGELIEVDGVDPYLEAEELLGWRDAAVRWYGAERDLRGYVPGRGWAHAVAHGADLLLAFARSRHLGQADLRGLLDTVTARLAASGGLLLTDGEDDRLAYATMAVLVRPELTGADVEGWPDGLAALAAVPGEGPPPASHANTAQYLRALYVQLHAGVHGVPGLVRPETFDRVPVTRDLLLDRLRAALRAFVPFLRPAGLPDQGTGVAGPHG